MADDGTWEAPASYGQERLWLAGQLTPDSPLYRVAMSVRLPADADHATVVAALTALVDRHEILRTTLRAGRGPNDTLTQVIHDTVPVDIAEVDARTEPVDRATRATAATDLRAPIPLDVAPLWRARLVRAADGCALSLVAHHTLVDGGSQPLFRAEFTELYSAQVERRRARLPALSIQYADYAAWQREKLGPDRITTGLGYWTETLRGAPSVHSLRTDRPRPRTGGAQPGADLHFSLPAGTAGAAADLGWRHGASEVMVLLAGWLATLHRMSAGTDLVVGVPVGGRDDPQVAPLIGMFVNTVAIRVRAEPADTFVGLVEQVRDALLGAWDHQDVPIQHVIEAVVTHRDPAHPPLFQLGFNHLGAMALQRCGGAAPEELSLEISEDDARLEYRTDLFDEATAERITRVYSRLVPAAIAAPRTPLGQLPVADDAEIDAWVEARDDTAAPYPTDVTVVDLVYARAGETPDAVAISGVTYAELVERVEALAGRLRGGGARPVAVCLPRGVDLAVTLLAVLRTGAPFVPVDPDYPPARRALLVEDTGAVMVDGDLPDSGPPGPMPVPADLAYILHTSGSTGRPKGVMVEHGSLVAHLTRFVRDTGLAPGDRMLLTASPGFDPFLAQLFGPLVAGATVVVGPPDGLRDPAAVVSACAAERVTVLDVVPTALRLLADRPGLADCRDLRLITCGGEPLTADVLDALWRRLPVPVDNMYGPTETVIDVTRHRCEPPVAADPVPIGRPVANARLYVVDPCGRPLPPGVPGELHVAGPQVARGYWLRPALTAAAFRPDPYGPPGSRRYATGDLARWRPDGTLEFLGRIDQQLTLHGQRIEPGEIVAALRALPGVTDAAIAVHHDVLVGYVVGTPTPHLRAALRTSLPAHLVPAHLVPLAALPRTPGGKLDTAALPPPTDGPTREITPPRTAAEELVAGVWAEVLGVAAVGAHDDFFDLGGQSLQAVRIAGRLADDLALEVPVRWVFETGTVAALAAAVEAAIEAEVADLSDAEVERQLTENRRPT
jgi:amino acid adenylation domain-containing protein